MNPVLSALYSNEEIAVRDGAIQGLHFYPRPVQERAFEIGFTGRGTVRRNRHCFMLMLYVVMLIALLQIIGLWNGVHH